MNFASSESDFEELVVRLNATVDTSRRLPGWPFRRHDGGVVICEFGVAMSASFTNTVDALTTYYDDQEVIFATLSPPWTYHSSGYGFFPGFVADGPNLGSRFAEAVDIWPDGDPTGSLTESSNVAAMAGSSSKWAVTAQRDWEIGLLWTADPAGPWLDS